MITAAWDTSNLVALYKDGKQCTTCCTPPPPGGYADNDCCCFLEPETPFACGNADWNIWPPFGGPGKTPAKYTVSCKVVWKTSGHVTTFEGITLGSGPSEFSPCNWQGVSGIDSDGVSCQIEVLALRVFGVQTKIFWKSTGPGDVCEMNAIPSPGQTTYRAPIIVADCFIIGNETFDSTPIPPVGFCGFRRIDANTIEYGDFTISWRPGAIQEWDNSTSYVSGDVVAHSGAFYRCNTAHTNEEPPNVSFWTVI